MDVWNRKGVGWEISQSGIHSGHEPFTLEPFTDNNMSLYFCPHELIFILKPRYYCVISVLSIQPPPPPPTLYDCCVPHSSQPFPLLNIFCTRRALHGPHGFSCVSTLPYKWRHWLWGLFDTHSHTVQTQLIFSGALSEWRGGG